MILWFCISTGELPNIPFRVYLVGPKLFCDFLNTGPHSHWDTLWPAHCLPAWSLKLVQRIPSTFYKFWASGTERADQSSRISVGTRYFTINLEEPNNKNQSLRQKYSEGPGYSLSFLNNRKTSKSHIRALNSIFFHSKDLFHAERIHQVKSCPYQKYKYKALIRLLYTQRRAVGNVYNHT